MVAVSVGVAAQLLSQQVSDGEGTLSTLLFSLRRSLAQEAIDEQMWEDLEAVLGEFAPLTSHEVTVIAARFRTATNTLVKFVPHLLRPYPAEEMRHLIFVSGEHPPPENARRHLNWFAMAILAVLDLMGDDAV